MLLEDDSIKEKRRSSLSPLEKMATNMIMMMLDITNTLDRKLLRKIIDLESLNCPLIVQKIFAHERYNNLVDKPFGFLFVRMVRKPLTENHCRFSER